jgi:DNA-directed RNA polymerase subunit RPC12/RpoP
MSKPAVIQFPCLQCGKKLKVQEELAGKKVKCPGCGNNLAVPKSAVAALATQAKPISSSLEDEKTLLPRALAGAEARTLPPKNRGQAGKVEQVPRSCAP